MESVNEPYANVTGTIPFPTERDIHFTGTQINYYFVCKRKLWLFSHNIELERESDLVQQGKLLHERSYKRKLKEIQVDRIKVDFLESKITTEFSQNSDAEISLQQVDADRKESRVSVILHEVKKSKSMHKAHTFQLLYYMFYLREKYDVNVAYGMLHYPLLKTQISVELTEENMSELKDVITSVKTTVSLAKPPEPVWIKPCRLCAYTEMCWG